MDEAGGLQSTSCEAGPAGGASSAGQKKTCPFCFQQGQILLKNFFAVNSVTRLGDLLDFGRFSKHLAKSPTFLGNFSKMSKSLIFLLKSFLGNF